MARSLAVRTDLALLRLGTTSVRDAGDHLVVSTPDNPDYWWGNFLLLPQVPPAEECGRWVERHRAQFPAARHVALAFDVAAGTKSDLAGFAALGLAVEASTVLTAHHMSPPRRSHPGAVNRPLSGDEDWAQSVRLTLRCHYPDGTPDQERFARAKAAGYRRLVDGGHGGWFGAFVDGRLVAQLGLFAVGDDLARFQAVETDPALRRQGLAGALMHHAGRYGLADRGASTLVVVADPDDVAIGLYRALGLTDCETQLQVSRGGLP